MNRLVEIRSYKLKPGATEDFHRVVIEQAVPILRRWDTDVVAFGPSPHEADTYFLARSYESLEDRSARQDAFHGSDAWRSGPREAVVGRIESYFDTMLWLPEEAIASLRQLNAPPTVIADSAAVRQ